MAKIAVATGDGETVSPGHFAHAASFLVFEGGRVVEVRSNPLHTVPDLDDPAGASGMGGEMHHGLHGIAKYRLLREHVLGDVDVVICSGGCPTSITYFVSEGVRMVFTDPGYSVEDAVRLVTSVDPEDLPAISVIEDGRLVTDY